MDSMNLKEMYRKNKRATVIAGAGIAVIALLASSRTLKTYLDKKKK